LLSLFIVGAIGAGRLEPQTSAVRPAFYNPVERYLSNGKGLQDDEFMPAAQVFWGTQGVIFRSK
jgi:hypothetical protein